MPNPFFIIIIFALTLAVVRVITITVHEMGHAIAGMLFLKGDFDIYIGSYGDPEKGIHFKIGRLKFHFIYDPFSMEKGVFRPEEQTNLAFGERGSLAQMLINHLNILKTIQLSRFKNSNSINFDYSNLFATFGYYIFLID